MDEEYQKQDYELKRNDENIIINPTFVDDQRINEIMDSTSISDSESCDINEGSMNLSGVSCCSSSEMVEDASSSSSTSTSTSSSSYGPLFELSELIQHLPIKRGLSKYYEGKSQTYASLASVQSLEDLAKKDQSRKKLMKSCKSYGGGLERYGPKATIAKKSSSSLRGSFLFSHRGAVLGNSRSSFHLQKKL